MNAQRGRRLAVDLPSGLDADSGRASPHTVRADVTCTFVGLKVGFLAPSAAEYLGTVHVVPIGLTRAMAAATCGLEDRPSS
jgi:NAD(P)H-hydrate epimerase